jgi:hypothetical protein
VISERARAHRASAAFRSAIACTRRGGQYALSLHDDCIVDERAIKRERCRPARFGFTERIDNPLRPRNLIGGGRKRAIDRFDVIGMDA